MTDIGASKKYMKKLRNFYPGDEVHIEKEGWFRVTRVEITRSAAMWGKGSKGTGYRGGNLDTPVNPRARAPSSEH